MEFVGDRLAIKPSAPIARVSVRTPTNAPEPSWPVTTPIIRQIFQFELRHGAFPDFLFRPHCVLLPNPRKNHNLKRLRRSAARMNIGTAPTRSITNEKTPTRALAQEKRRREQRDAGAAGLRHHLRGVGLQRVVQHVEAEPQRHRGERRRTTRQARPQGSRNGTPRIAPPIIGDAASGRAASSAR